MRRHKRKAQFARFLSVPQQPYFGAILGKYCCRFCRFLTSIRFVNRCAKMAFRGAQLLQEGEEGMPSTKSGGSKRGFAAMDPAKQREIASKGGKASHGGGRKSSSSR